METDRWEGGVLHVYREGDRNCVGENERYVPKFTIEAANESGHWGGDFFTSYYFVRNLLGDPDAKANCIDVYQAVDMCIPGILGYRSILNGNDAVAVPDLRDPAQREQYRHDTFCTFEESAGSMYVPNDAMQATRGIRIEDSVYEEVRRRFLAGEPG